MIKVVNAGSRIVQQAAIGSDGYAPPVLAPDIDLAVLPLTALIADVNSGMCLQYTAKLPVIQPVYILGCKEAGRIQ